MNTLWHIELLGGLKAHRDGEGPLRFQKRKTASVLAYLAYHIKQEHSRESLIETFWQEGDPASKSHSLSQALTTLRRLLESGLPAGSVLQSFNGNVRLSPVTVETDVPGFTIALQAARQSQNPKERLQRMQQALARYPGALLPGFFDDWVEVERDRLTRLHVYALRQCALDYQHLGDMEQALEYALRAVETAPEMIEPR